MEDLIPLVNKLQDVFNAIGTDPVDLPQIAVVGAQSAGKSSVLENIVGKDFLPRGSGIVTRRPLVLQLIQVPAGSRVAAPAAAGPPGAPGPDAPDEWGEFLHLPNKMFARFADIRDEIVRETDRLTGDNKAVSPVPINLKVYSPRVVSLTLVDLPGLTRVPVGDQPADIEAQIRRMILTYIAKPTCIILAVTAANQDLATSDALMLAREVDPDGARTLGVITKIDIMDQGTNALDVLSGKVIPLSLGYVGVVNRSQQDIIQQVDIRRALAKERAYFVGHPLYKTIANRSGTQFLAKRLNAVLIDHIRDSLPGLKHRIGRLLAEAEAEMATYGDSLPATKNGQGALLLQLITKFANSFAAAIDGALTTLSTQELYGGARINFIFNEVFGRCVWEMDPLAGLTLDDVKTTIKNAAGLKSALFVPERSFELLVKRQIKRLEPPCSQCVELVFEELQRIVGQVESRELARFAALRKRVGDVALALLRDLLAPTRDMIANLMAVELSFVNTSHPDFEGGDGALAKVVRQMAAERQAHADAAAGAAPAAAREPTPSLNPFPVDSP